MVPICSQRGGEEDTQAM